MEMVEKGGGRRYQKSRRKRAMTEKTGTDENSSKIVLGIEKHRREDKGEE